MHAEWHVYFETVYGHAVDSSVDLNAFEWFYHSAPLHLHNISPRQLVQCNGTDSTCASWLSSLQEGEVWYTYDFIPRRALALVGVFVMRNTSFAGLPTASIHADVNLRRPIEVLRAACPTEHGETWRER